MQDVLAPLAVLGNASLLDLDCAAAGLREDRVAHHGVDEVGNSWPGVGRSDGSLLDSVQPEVELSDVFTDLALDGGGQVPLL